MDFPIVVIGGGPAGAAAGGLLASWGHSVLLLDHSDPAAARARGLAESLPPSSRKVLAQTGLLAAVEAAGFYRSTGNTVSWGADDRRVESFGGELGYQVFRPDLDRVLLDAARASGVVVHSGAQVRGVDSSPAGTAVRFRDGGDMTLRARWVLDCSGRAGVLARRVRRPGRRTYALVGEWTGERGWHLPDPTHTFVEAFADGWSWSIPTSPVRRQVGLMIDGSLRRDGRELSDTYRAELQKSPAMADTLRAAALGRVWACDAATYSSARVAARNWLLVGDAASFVDPLSSAGVKKALTSAWLAAVVVNTCVVDPARVDTALGFFSEWEAEVCATHAQRSREFAAEAAARVPTPFWQARAEACDDRISGPVRQHQVVRREDRDKALHALRCRDAIALSIDKAVRFERRAVVRGREIVLEDALVPPGAESRNASTAATRFVDNVDVVALARLAGRYTSVPELFEAYCLTVGPAPLPNVLGGLSWLVAAGILRHRNAVPC